MHDAIVIGVGGMGSATAYHLARAGLSVLGLEQFGIAHAFGSSHGSTRIIRLAYSEGPEYIPLLRAAYGYWRELGEVAGEAVLRTTGGLDIGPESSWTVRGSRESCLQYGIDFEELDAADVNRRFPGCSLPPSMRAVYQPDGGYLLSERAITAYTDAARAHGAEIRTHEKAVGWERCRGGLRVKTESGAYSARRLVLTAGPWIGGLCPAFSELCKVQRQVMLWTAPTRPADFEPSRFPVFNMETPIGRFYGFPDHEGEGFKIGKYYHLHQAVPDPGQLDRECGPQDEAVLREGIERYFPNAGGPTRRMAACMFTNSPSGAFILDNGPGEDDVFVAAGFSGHGFKFCSVVGKIMAELCAGRPSPWDISRFSVDRSRRDAALIEAPG